MLPAREASGFGSPYWWQSSDSGCTHGTVLGFAFRTRSTFTPSDCFSSRLPREVRPRQGGCGQVKVKQGCREGGFTGFPGSPCGRGLSLCSVSLPSCVVPPVQQMAMMCQERHLFPAPIGGSAAAPVTVGVPGSRGWIASQLFP